MSFSDFITHHGKRINKDYFLHLIQVSRTDGKLDAAELKFLHREGRKFGLTDPEIDKLIASESTHHYVAPYSLHEKFEHLYNITQMILADDVVTEGEKKMIRKFAIESGFDDKILEELVEMLINGVSEGKDEEALLKEYRKKYL